MPTSNPRNAMHGTPIGTKGPIGPHFTKCFESCNRAKSWINDAVSTCIQTEGTHSDLIFQAITRVNQTDWYRVLPVWAKSQIQGHRDCLLSGRWSPIQRELRFCHLYRGLLYRNFEMWRLSFPDVSGAELTNCGHFVWKSGKIFSGDLEGQTFPFAPDNEF
jgi:hypothetical protein